jgi:hypothetical protein
MGRILVGAILIIIGINALFGLSLWQYFWPAILIILGLWILLGRNGEGRHHHPRFTEGKVIGEETSSHFDYSATFQGVDKKVVTEDFRGGKIEATLGGLNLDLREAKIKSKTPVTLRVEATLGGINIKVPSSWLVENRIHGVAGGVHDTTIHPSEKNQTGHLILTGSVTLGGVEITN